LENPYLPYPVRIDKIVTETEDRNLKTFRFVFLNPEDEKKFSYPRDNSENSPSRERERSPSASPLLRPRRALSPSR
jgi:hypothetical protein